MFQRGAPPHGGTGGWHVVLQVGQLRRVIVAVYIIDIRDGSIPLDASSDETGQTDACCDVF